MEDSAVGEVMRFRERVDAAKQGRLGDFAVGAANHERDVLLRLHGIFQALNIESFRAVEPERFRAFAVCKFEREHAHADQVRAVDAFKALRHDCAHAEKRRALRRPVAGRAHAVIDSGEDDERRSRLFVGFAGFENRGQRSRRLKFGKAAFLAVRHLVFDAHIGKGAAHHDAVVPATRAVGVEFFARNAAFGEVFPGGCFGRKCAGGRNVVGCHGIAEDGERAHSRELRRRRKRHAEAVEIRRELDVGRIVAPAEERSRRRGNGFPFCRCIIERSVALGEHFGFDAGGDERVDFRLFRPNVFEVNGLPVRSRAERFVFQIDIDAPREREGNDERRRHEEIRFDERMNARFEIAVAGKHTRRNEFAVANRGLDFGRERTGIAYTGRAAVADEIEAEFVQIRRQARRVQIIRNDAGTRRERGFHIRGNAQTFFHGAFRDQAGGDEHARIRSVCAARNRGDDDGAVAQRSRLGCRALRFFAEFVERVFHVSEFDAILRAFRSGNGTRNRRKIKLDDFRVVDFARFRHAEKPLRLEIIAHDGDFLFVAPGEAQVVERFFVNREKAHRRAVFRSHVGNGRAIGERERCRAFAEKFDKFADDLRRAENFRHAERKIRGEHAFRERSREVHADNFRRLEANRLSEHSCFRLDAADAPADDADAVDHCRVRVRSDDGIRVENRSRGRFFFKNNAREIFQIHLVADPDGGRHDGKRFERALPPLEQFVALGVAGKILFDVFAKRVGRSRVVDLHGVVDDHIHRHERLDERGIASELGDGIAHRGEVNKQRHARQILQKHARDGKRDFRVGGLCGVPVGKRANVVFRNQRAVAVAKHAFEDDAQANRHFRDLTDSRLFKRGNAVVKTFFAGCRAVKFAKRLERIVHNWGAIIEKHRRSREKFPRERIPKKRTANKHEFSQMIFICGICEDEQF